MKRFLSLVLSFGLLQAATAFGAMVQDWSNVGSGMAGTYQDSTGSKIEFTFDAGPNAGEKALKLTTTLASGGYAGVYTSGTFDLSKFGVLTFMAKSTVPGDVQIAIKDAFNVQYIGKVSIPSNDWTLVTLTLSSLAKDPYYTPPDAIAGHPMDLSKVGNLNFSPQMAGSSVVLIGPVSGSGTPSAAASTSNSTSTTAAVTVPSGPGVQVLDPTTLDSKSAGTFQDSLGSSFTFTAKDNPSKKGQKYLAINYELKKGGYAGMWARAGGSDWNGVNLTGKKVLSLTIYSKDPISLGLAIKDATNNQYVADTPMTKGGKWETVLVNMSDFKLDPYYTPPDAKKGAPEDLSKVTGFNIQAKTEGKFTVAVDNVVAK